MSVHYLSESEADSLNELFQQVLAENPLYRAISKDIYLFSTEFCLAKEQSYKLAVIQKTRGQVTDADRVRVQNEMRLARISSPINSGSIDLSNGDSFSKGLNKFALDFLLKNSKRIDYISGLIEARGLGFDVPGRHDILEYGVPLRITRRRNRQALTLS